MSDLAIARARNLVGRFPETRVLVIGDVMLDEFLTGHVSRISPEAPVPIVEFDRQEYRLGGAANVAHNARSLGAPIDLVGVVGRDDAGAQLVRQLSAHDIHAEGMVTADGRRTTRKLRIVTDRNQQVARVDYETDAEIDGRVEAEVAERVERLAAGARAIVVSDYLKGVVTRRVMTRIIELGRRHGLPVLVDPKIPHLDLYAGATVITPNQHETEVATHRRIKTDAEAAAAALAFRERAGCAGVLVTRGEHGMCLVADPSSGRCEHIAAAAHEVADVTGAGDTVIATLALALGAGASLGEAARLASYAAGVAVAKFGTATIRPAELLATLDAA